MQTALAKQLGVEFPIVAFTHCRDVVAAVTRAGGLGVLGAVVLSPERLAVELDWIDQHLGGLPYGVDTLVPASYAARAPTVPRPRRRASRRSTDGSSRT
jgi:hypothetical protein